MLNLKTIQSFSLVIKNLEKKPSFIVHYRGSRKIIISSGKAIAAYNTSTNKETKEQRSNARKIMTETRSSATRYIRKHLDSIIPIERKAPVTYINRELWISMPVNSIFYLCDANHCYWRVAYTLGYISKKLYLKYCDNPEFKTLRNIALAILNSSIKREYFRKGKLTHSISCDISLYQQLYTNIRHYTYNNSGQVLDKCPELCIAYRVDGVYVLPKGLNATMTIFKKNNLLYKTQKCIKIDSNNYSTADGEIKKMI
jgi:hypothetical protein